MRSRVTWVAFWVTTGLVHDAFIDYAPGIGFCVLSFIFAFFGFDCAWRAAFAFVRVTGVLGLKGWIHVAVPLGLNLNYDIPHGTPAIRPAGARAGGPSPALGEPRGRGIPPGFVNPAPGPLR